MKKNNIFEKFIILLVGILSCFMLSMLHVGNGINLRCFLGTEKVYDFPERDLTKDSKGWEYHTDEQGYYLVKKNAVNKYRVDRKTGKWKCLYLTVDKMNVSAIGATLEYYNKDMELLGEQPISLSLGENIIILNEEIPICYVGIRILDAEGTFFSIQSMQARSEVSGYTPKRFAKAMIASSLAFLLIFGIWIFWQKRNSRKGNHFPVRNNILIDVLQNIFIIFGNYAGSWMRKKIKTDKRNMIQRSIFSIMFLWIIFSEFSGLCEGEGYRYFALGCVLCLVFAAILTWEKPLVEINWRNPLALSWCILWIMVIISDIFVDAGNKFIGYVMLFAAGFMIFVWNQTEKPKKVLRLMMEALEIDFGLVAVFCMLFRQKKTAVYYNGVFQTSEKMAMYSLLMFGIFLIELLHVVRKNGNFRSYTIYGSGTAVSLYFILRSGGVTAYVALGLILIVAGGREIITFVHQKESVTKKLGKDFFKMLMAVATAFVVTVFVHVSVEHLPGYLGTDISFENEQLISVLPTEELIRYQMALPEELDGVVSYDTLKIGVYQKNYARKIGLLGNIDPVYVYRKPVSAYSGYLDIMYRYGIYALVPFIMYQFYGMYMVAENCKKKGQTTEQEYMLILLINVVYICFCIAGNAGITLEHPLTWCFFLMNGYGFFRNS